MNSDDRDSNLLRLPNEIEPPPGVEDRLVSELRRRGHLRAPRRFSPAWTRAAAAALLLVVFGSGFALGVSANPFGAPSPSSERSHGSRYLLLLSSGETSGDAAAAEARAGEYAAWARELGGRGQLVAADELSDVEWTLDGETPAEFHSGAPTTQRPNGFFLLRARDDVEARAIAASCPHLRHGGQLSLRPIRERD
jgi:hypothetical protein